MESKKTTSYLDDFHGESSDEFKSKIYTIVVSLTVKFDGIKISSNPELAL